MICLALVRIRARMAWNSARAASGWHKAALLALSVLSLGLAAIIGFGCAVPILLAQGGAHSILTPSARSITEHLSSYVFLLLAAGSVPFVAATLFAGLMAGLGRTFFGSAGAFYPCSARHCACAAAANSAVRGSAGAYHSQSP